MGHKMKIWLALLFAVLAWSMTLGQGVAKEPLPEVSLALTKDAAVGERAELVALVIGADGKPMEGEWRWEQVADGAKRWQRSNR